MDDIRDITASEFLLALELASPGSVTTDEMMMVMASELSDMIDSEPEHKTYKWFSDQTFKPHLFYDYFRFHQEDIPQLISVLGMQENYRSPTRVTWDAEEGLCLVLRRLSYPNRLVDLIPLFGRPKSELSIIFNETLHDLYMKNGARLTTIDHSWFEPERYCDAVYKKCGVLDNIWGFVDGTVKHICRPGKGQRLLFNGQKHYHGIKY